MKKLAALLLTMAMVLSLSACSLTTNAPADSGSADTGSDAAAADSADGADSGSTVEEAADAIHFDLSTTGAKGSLLGDVCDHFADQVKELSNGEMIVDVYYSSALGSEAQNLEALTAGTLDMAIIAIEFYSNTIPELGALILPYLYDDYDQVQSVLSGEAGAYASERLRETAGVENLGYYVMMFRNMYLNRAINSVDDMAGLKIRVPESALYVNTMKMMGAAPTTISMSAKVFDGLTAEQQDILRQAGAETSAFGLQTTKDAEEDNINQLRELMTVVETDTESMRGAIDYTNYDFMSSKEAQTLFDLVQKATAK